MYWLFKIPLEILTQPAQVFDKIDMDTFRFNHKTWMFRDSIYFLSSLYFAVRYFGIFLDVLMLPLKHRAERSVGWVQNDLLHVFFKMDKCVTVRVLQCLKGFLLSTKKRGGSSGKVLRRHQTNSGSVLRAFGIRWWAARLSVLNDRKYAGITLQQHRDYSVPLKKHSRDISLLQSIIEHHQTDGKQMCVAEWRRSWISRSHRCPLWQLWSMQVLRRIILGRIGREWKKTVQFGDRDVDDECVKIPKELLNRNNRMVTEKKPTFRY